MFKIESTFSGRRIWWKHTDTWTFEEASAGFLTSEEEAKKLMTCYSTGVWHRASIVPCPDPVPVPVEEEENLSKLDRFFFWFFGLTEKVSFGNQTAHWAISWLIAMLAVHGILFGGLMLIVLVLSWIIS